MTLKTPVAFFVFNRPDLTQIVFDAIRKAQPKKLLVVADGPRRDRQDEVKKCLAARAVIDQVDWNCEVLTSYSEINLGCGRRVSSGLNWIFSEVEEAIILEDDCLPSQSFFLYCQDLLEYYRNEPRVTSINGSNLGFYEKSYKYSYRFTKFMNMWGWATWKRSFEIIDFDMKFWDSFKQSFKLRRILGRDKEWLNYWIYKFDEVDSGRMDTWDYQWILSNLYHEGLVVSPTSNMIRNLGYRDDATHTPNQDHHLAKLKENEVNFPLVHPKKIKISKDYDNYIKSAWCDDFYPSLPLFNRVINKTNRVILDGLSKVLTSEYNHKNS